MKNGASIATGISLSAFFLTPTYWIILLIIEIYFCLGNANPAVNSKIITVSCFSSPAGFNNLIL